MGATFDYTIIKANNTSSFRKKYAEYIEDIEYEYGHDPYNGTLTTCSSPIQAYMPNPPKRLTPKGIDKILEWLSDNVDKRDARYVKIGKNYIVGGWAAC